MRCVVFDLDGTLADTSADLLAAANACLPRACLGPEDALKAFHGGRAMLRLGFDRLGLDWTEAEVDAAYPVLLEAYRGGIATHTRLYPGAMAAVEGLKTAGFAVSICTNKPEELAELLLSALGVRGGGGVAGSLVVVYTETDAKRGVAAGVPVALVTFGPEGAGVSRFRPAALLDRFEDLPGLAGRFLG